MNDKRIIYIVILLLIQVIFLPILSSWQNSFNTYITYPKVSITNISNNTYKITGNLTNKNSFSINNISEYVSEKNKLIRKISIYHL